MSPIPVLLGVPGELTPSLLHVGVQTVRVTVPCAQDVFLSLSGFTRTPIPVTDPSRPVRLPLHHLDRFQLTAHLGDVAALPCRLSAVLANGTMVADEQTSLLPANAWKYWEPPQALAGFVQPASQAVARITEAARPFLQRLLGVGGFLDALNLLTPSRPDTAARMAEAVYRSLKESFAISYVAEPRTYPVDWQKIRFHDQILGDRHGTCMDLALLMMACLESAHLDPLLVVVKTGAGLQHALVGCWSQESREDDRVVRNGKRIADHLAPHGSGQLLLFDVTGVTQERRWPFADACAEALKTWGTALGFVWAIDLVRTRQPTPTEQAISPMPLGDGVLQSEQGWLSLRHAQDLARTTEYDVVERTHLLAALFHTAPDLLTDLWGASAATLHQTLMQRLNDKSPHRTVQRVTPVVGLRNTLDRARLLAHDLGSGLVGPVQLLHALLESESKTLQRSLKEVGIEPREAMTKLSDMARRDPQRQSYLDSQAPEGRPGE